ncbi:hypothetical protein F4677DRAFT_443983 [Hypoxylon crocopeplum]|nr:hypothetical protein F4677DRAFT_443983 [Hypoxylon crocopeplum]
MSELDNSIVYGTENTPNRESPGKRKADEITVDENDGEEAGEISEEPETKRIKAESQSKEELMNSIHKRWDTDMEMPRGGPRPKFIGESEEDRTSGSGTVDDPLIVFLGKIPVDEEIKIANQDIAREAALRFKSITHIYIRCAAQSSMFVDRDGKRIPIWNPDRILFYHETKAADPHISLMFGTDASNLVLHGYINVTVDEDGKPTDFASSRNEDYVVDGDDRIFELFQYDLDQQDCAPYCSSHASSEVPINSCELAQPRYCPIHGTEGLLDHWCCRARWKTEVYEPTKESRYCADHYRQERLVYDFYKAHEASWEYYQEERDCSLSDITTQTKAHNHLTLAILARELHTEWFFGRGDCWAHEDHVHILRCERRTIEHLILQVGLAYDRAGVDVGVRQALEEAMMSLTSSSTSEDLYEHKLLQSLPCIQIIDSKELHDEIVSRNWLAIKW